MNYLSLKYSESVPAFQLQFGIYEAESMKFALMLTKSNIFHTT